MNIDAKRSEKFAQPSSLGILKARSPAILAEPEL